MSEPPVGALVPAPDGRSAWVVPAGAWTEDAHNPRGVGLEAPTPSAPPASAHRRLRDSLTPAPPNPAQPDPTLPAQVRASALPGAGLGLFAAAPLRAGSIICEYRGKVLTLKGLLQTADRSYAMGLALNLYLDAASADGLSAPLSLARFVNDHPVPESRNCAFQKIPSRRKALLVASRDVAAGAGSGGLLQKRPFGFRGGNGRDALRPVAGEELYAPYGDGYWARLGGIPPLGGKP